MGLPTRRSTLKTTRPSPTTRTMSARSVNARRVSSPTTTWLAPQASTSNVLSGECAPASTMMAPAKPVSSWASSRSIARCTAPPWMASRSAT